MIHIQQQNYTKSIESKYWYPLFVFSHHTMLPYFRGMEAFSISLPKSWSELSDQQLLFFFRQVARDLPINEVLALCVCKWAEIVVLCHADKHSCLVKDRKSKRQVVLADWQITFAARQLAWELCSQACAHFCYLRCIGSKCRFASRPLWGLSRLRELLPRLPAHAKHGMPRGDDAFALSETFGQSLFGESGTAFCILLVRFRQSELHPYVSTPDFITFLCHHIAHIENQWVVSFDWVTHWRSLQKTLPPNASTNGGDASRVGHQGKGSQAGM